MISADPIKSISSRADFVSFVQQLSREFQADAPSWENRDLGSYLAALAAWVEDMDGYYINRGLPVPEKPDWQNVADMLKAATLYE